MLDYMLIKAPTNLQPASFIDNRDLLDLLTREKGDQCMLATETM